MEKFGMIFGGCAILIAAFFMVWGVVTAIVYFAAWLLSTYVPAAAAWKLSWYAAAAIAFALQFVLRPIFTTTATK